MNSLIIYGPIKSEIFKWCWRTMLIRAKTFNALPRCNAMSNFPCTCRWILYLIPFPTVAMQISCKQFTSVPNTSTRFHDNDSIQKEEYRG